MIGSFATHTEDETINLGIVFAQSLNRGDVVALYGDLGSGKTRFIQGVCKGLGVHEHVASPTFTIVNEYTVGDLRIYHIDFYRIRSLKEVQDVGFEDYINDGGICLVEWADKGQELLPPRRYEIFLMLGADELTREITITHIVEVSA